MGCIESIFSGNAPKYESCREEEVQSTKVAQIIQTPPKKVYVRDCRLVYDESIQKDPTVTIFNIKNSKDKISIKRARVSKNDTYYNDMIKFARDSILVDLVTENGWKTNMCLEAGISTIKVDKIIESIYPEHNECVCGSDTSEYNYYQFNPEATPLVVGNSYTIRHQQMPDATINIRLITSCESV